ncbi:MAG: diguanylate cyclase [Planctomycetes bacterium]|nr:diguanylate cyclase [Planctomycetota bacterium]
MFEEIEKLVADGQYEKALTVAKRRSIDLLKENNRASAATALARAAELLCVLNNPAKARGFAQESLELATRANDRLAAAYAHAAAALSHLRLGDIEKAESELDAALDPSTPVKDSAPAAFIRLIGAEISLAKEDVAEAIAFARDALGIGTALQDPIVKIRALLIKAVAEERNENLAGALELLREAEAQLQKSPNGDLAWQVKGAIANVLFKSKQDESAAQCRKEASTLIEGIAAQLSTESRDRFLKNPAVATALGAEASGSGIFRAPVQVRSQTARSRKDETSFMGLRPVLEVIKKINSELNLRRLITTILDTMIEFCNAERGTIVVFDDDKFKIELSRNRDKTDLKREDMGISRGVLKLVRDKGRKIVAENAQQDPELRLIDSVQEQQLLSILCLPLRVKLRLVGAIYLDNPRVTGAFGPREIEIAEILTDHAAVAIDNALLHIKSIHEALTNLYNHAHFEKRLENEVARCRRHNRPCSVLMLDIDNFKHVNDTFGHDTGNEVLRAVSRIIASTVRNVDLVARIQERDAAPVIARYGGDEFEIVLPETTVEGAQKVSERILQSVRDARFQHDGHEVSVTISIGSATFPDDAPDPRAVMLRADEALYAAKRQGKNRHIAYAPMPK